MKYKTEFSSIFFNDEQFVADEDGIVEGDFPSSVVDFYKLSVLDEQESVDQQKEEKKTTRKPRKDKKESE
jgi:hypothetical protein